VTIDVTDATFQTEVIERSDVVPVVVDVWATWCQPCRTLGPILERVVDATGGKVLLAKVDADTNPQVSATFGVQSIPAVYAVRHGKVVGGFVGARGEREVQEFVDSLAPSEQDEAVAALLAAGDEPSLRTALEIRPDDEAVVLALATVLVDGGRAEEALEVLARVPETPATRQVAARARQGDQAFDDIEGRLEALLESVKHDEEARRDFVDLLELLGPDDPRTPVWRKRLTSRLY
jgi:putative thioredoxin